MWRLVAYMGYAVVMLGLFLYLLFPSGPFQEWLLARAEQVLDADLLVREQSVRFPLGVQWDGVIAAFGRQRPNPFDALGIQAESLQVDFVRVNPHLLSMFLGRARFEIESRLLDGRLKGTVAIERQGGDWQYRVLADGGHLDLGRLNWRHLSSGLATLVVDLSWAGQNGAPVLGSIEFHGTDLTIVLGGVPPLAVSSLSAQVTRGGSGWWALENLRGTALDDHLTLQGHGRFFVKEPSRETIVNLSLTLTIQEGVSREFPQLAALQSNHGEPALLTVTGTVSRPVVMINGVPIIAANR